MNRKISAIAPGATNEGQYHLGYQTPERSSLPSPRRRLRRRRGSGASSASTAVAVVSVAISGTSLDLGPRVEPHLVDLRWQLVRREVLLEHVLRNDRRRQRRGDDALLDERLRVDRIEWGLIPVVPREVLGPLRLVEHEVDELVRESRVLRRVRDHQEIVADH